MVLNFILDYFYVWVYSYQILRDRQDTQLLIIYFIYLCSKRTQFKQLVQLNRQKKFKWANIKINKNTKKLNYHEENYIIKVKVCQGRIIKVIKEKEG